MGIFDNFPYSNFHELNLDWVLREVKRVIAEAAQASKDVASIREYVQNYFANLDVSDEINAKLEDMAQSGELENIIAAYLELNTPNVFATVADMAASPALVEGASAMTKGFHEANDGGGGFYNVVRVTNTLNVNGANVIALNNPVLCAVLISNIANVRQYGAKGDGVTDDSPAFIAACDSGLPVHIPHGNFYINSEIPVSKGRTVYGIGQTFDGSKVTMGDNGIFRCTIDNVTFRNIIFNGNNTETSDNGLKAIRVENPNGDSDLTVESCTFRYIHTPIHVVGRGCQISNTNFVQCYKCVTAAYSGENTNNPLDDDISGARGLRITGCRFHSVNGLGYAIGIPANCVVYNPIITDNQQDLGLGAFFSNEGSIYGGIIGNNVVGFSTTAPINIKGASVKGLRIVGNTFKSDYAEVGISNPPSYQIVFTAETVERVTIAENDIRETSLCAIRFDISKPAYCNIVNNVMSRIAKDGLAIGAIYSGSGLDRCIITGNTLSDLYGASGYFVHGNANNKDLYTNNIIVNNSRPAGIGMNTVSVFTSDNGNIIENNA